MRCGAHPLPLSVTVRKVHNTLAWNSVGGWGSLQMPLESLIVANPGGAPFESELWQNVSNASPAGGAMWMRVIAAN